MEGLSLPGRLTPEDPKIEASRLGSFQSKVENASAAKGVDGDERSKKRKQSEEENLKESVILELESEDVPHKLSGEKKEPVKVSYTIKFNKYTEMVELVDIDSGKILQTINPNSFMELVSGLKQASGIFVDNEI